MESTVLEQPAINRRRLTPAATVIEVFGGVRVLARLLKCHASTVCVWQRRGGNVPSVHHKRLLELARETKLVLTANDLVYGRAVTRKGARR